MSKLDPFTCLDEAGLHGPNLAKIMDKIMHTMTIASEFAHPSHFQQMKKNITVHDMHKIPLKVNELLEPSLNSTWQVMKHSHFEQYVNMPIGWSSTLEELQAKWDWEFIDIIHLKSALTHFSRFQSSKISEFPSNRISNRSLEWLGDSILNNTTSIYLFQSYPLTQEGQLTQLRSALINNSILSQVATHMHLDSAILYAGRATGDEGSEASISMRQTMNASAVESLIGAVFLDQGISRAMEFVNTRILPLVIDLALNSKNWDPVSELQRRLTTQKRTVRYDREMVELTHIVTLMVDNEVIMRGMGGSNFKDMQRSIASHVLAAMDAIAPGLKYQ